MSWLRFRLETDASLAPLCEVALLELGASAVTLEDNADEPLFAQQEAGEQLWQNTRVTGLFPASQDTAQLWESLPATLRGSCQWRAEILEDKDWEREWMEHFKPRQFGESFWLCPSWLTPPDPEACNLLLDPGLAFGTGTHPTTAMCLGRLAELDLTGLNIVDYGCGSGILAIAALLLGAKQALATDTDPQAVTATLANARRNGIEPARIRSCLPADIGNPAPTDLVVANILSGPLISLADTLVGLLKPGGRLLLSGILDTQAEELQSHFPLPLTLCASSGDWVALEGRKP